VHSTQKAQTNISSI